MWPTLPTDAQNPEWEPVGAQKVLTVTGLILYNLEIYSRKKFFLMQIISQEKRKN